MAPIYPTVSVGRAGRYGSDYGGRAYLKKYPRFRGRTIHRAGLPLWRRAMPVGRSRVVGMVHEVVPVTDPSRPGRPSHVLVVGSRLPTEWRRGHDRAPNVTPRYWSPERFRDVEQDWAKATGNVPFRHEVPLTARGMRRLLREYETGSHRDLIGRPVQLVLAGAENRRGGRVIGIKGDNYYELQEMIEEEEGRKRNAGKNRR